MKVKEAAKESGYSELYIREWIASGRCPFGSWIKKNGSSRRIFKINEEAFKKWKKGEIW